LKQENRQNRYYHQKIRRRQRQMLDRLPPLRLVLDQKVLLQFLSLLLLILSLLLLLLLLLHCCYSL